MEPGVWLSEDPHTLAHMGNDVLLAVDVPVDLLDERWRSKLDPKEWQIPAQVIGPLGVRQIDSPGR
jgi:hypothetical protein